MNAPEAPGSTTEFTDADKAEIDNVMETLYDVYFKEHSCCYR